MFPTAAGIPAPGALVVAHSAAWVAARGSDERRSVDRLVSEPGQAGVDARAADDRPHLVDPLSRHHRDVWLRVRAGRTRPAAAPRRPAVRHQPRGESDLRPSALKQSLPAIL